MTAEELDARGADLFAFYAHFNNLFGRKETRTEAIKYQTGSPPVEVQDEHGE
jgi:hypothetical protein